MVLIVRCSWEAKESYDESNPKIERSEPLTKYFMTGDNQIRKILSQKINRPSNSPCSLFIWMVNTKIIR